MNLTELSNNIEREIHTDHKLSDSTKKRIKSAIENKSGLMKGGNSSGIDESNACPKPLSGFDAALIGSIQRNIPMQDPELKSEVMKDIISNGQRIMPNNANVYYTYLLNDRKELANTVNATLDRIEEMNGGALENHLYKLMGGAILIVVLLVVYVAINQQMTPKKSGFVYSDSVDSSKEGFVIVEEVIDETGINY